MAGLKKDEVRNAAVLATLLDPQQLGGLSRAFLANILEEVGLGYPAFAAIDVMEPYSVMTEACPLGARETRIDIVLEGRRFLLGMEVKIEALERPRQLSDYQFILQRKARLFNKSAALIFLSPRPSQALPEGVPHLTWRKLAKAASKAVRDRPDASEAGNLLHQFSSHINTFR
jgi:hypothetical protein